MLMFYSITSLKQDYFDSIGKRALSIAFVCAENIKLSNSEVERLLKLNINNLLDDSVNKNFENHVRKFMPQAGVKYIYIMRKLSSDQVKYYVNKEEVNYYQLPEGTKLNTIYLIDAVVDDKTRLEDTNNQYYQDKDRYTFLRESEEIIYNTKAPTYALVSDEWGRYITGYAPVYSIEGDYVGMMGVDIYIDEYLKLVNRRMIIIIIFTLLCTIMSIFLFKSFIWIFQTEETAKLFKEQSYLDDMTGMFNRRMLNEYSDDYWDKALQQKIPITVMMIDIDFFKTYNDKHGHVIGDKMIAEVASVIKLCTRDKKDLLFRYGGDELMIIFFNTEINTVLNIAERIRNQVKTISIKEVEDNITLSFGISSAIPNEDADLNQLIRQADQALYVAKENGRDGIHVYKNN